MFGIYFLILILTLCFKPQVVSTEAGADPDVQCLAVVPAPAVGAVGGQKLIPSRLNFEVTILAFLLSPYVSSVYIFPFSSILFTFRLYHCPRPPSFPLNFSPPPLFQLHLPLPYLLSLSPPSGQPPQCSFFLNALVSFI